MDDDQVYLVELRHEGDRENEYVEVWHCEPPDLGVQYRVIEDEWHDPNARPGETPTRHIYKIELLSDNVSS